MRLGLNDEGTDIVAIVATEEELTNLSEAAAAASLEGFAIMTLSKHTDGDTRLLIATEETFDKIAAGEIDAG